jgi:nucleotide-binding universal stress UspA family protein
MQRFQNILLAVEGESCAEGILDRAAVLACRNAAKLTIARALPAIPRELQRLTLPIDPESLLQLATEEHLARLGQMAQPWREQVHIETKVLWGTPFLEVIREVLAQEHDLVIVPAANKHPLGSLFFGSTSMHLMRKCPCPVWVLKPAAKDVPYRSVLAAVDALAYDDEHSGLNREIMKLATSLARMENCQLHVIHAWRPWTHNSFHPEGGYSGQFAADVGTQAENEHGRALDELTDAADIEGLVVHKHLVYGEAGEVIADTASTLCADIIVMGTVCRTGIPGFFIGNTAEAVLNRVNCSVLTLKPAGFVTPVQLRSKREAAVAR